MEEISGNEGEREKRFGAWHSRRFFPIRLFFLLYSEAVVLMNFENSVNNYSYGQDRRQTASFNLVSFL